MKKDRPATNLIKEHEYASLKNTFRDWYKLNSPWCPLFGQLPTDFLLGDPSSLCNDCINIIREARGLWNVESDYTYPGYPANQYGGKEEAWDISWPEPEQVPKYSRKSLESARMISLIHASILYATVDFWNPNFPGRQRENFIEDSNRPGEYIERYTLDSEWEKVCEIARRDYHVMKDRTYIEENIPDYEILAIVAISEAWRVLTDILNGEEFEGNPKILNRTRIAQALLQRAIQQALETEVETQTEAQNRQMAGFKKKNLKSAQRQKRILEQFEVLKKEGIKRNFFKEWLERFPNDRVSLSTFNRKIGKKK
jgi:hypothetical protein